MSSSTPEATVGVCEVWVVHSGPVPCVRLSACKCDVSLCVLVCSGVGALRQYSSVCVLGDTVSVHYCGCCLNVVVGMFLCRWVHQSVNLVY